MGAESSPPVGHHVGLAAEEDDRTKCRDDPSTPESEGDVHRVDCCRSAHRVDDHDRDHHEPADYSCFGCAHDFPRSVPNVVSVRAWKS